MMRMLWQAHDGRDMPAPFFWGAKMNREQALAAIRRYGSQRKAARALRVSRHTLAIALGTETDRNKKKKSVGHRRRSLIEFQQAHDPDTVVPAKINEAVKRMGPDGWLYEAELARLAGVSMTTLAQYRDLYQPLIVQLRAGRRAWAGSNELAQQMREMII